MLGFMIFIAGMIASGLAHSQNSAHCASISNPDQRAMCRALAEKKSTYCASIGNSDMRAMCRAQSENKASYCASIGNNDMRAQCRALAGR